MPTYTFRHRKTKKITETYMKMAEKEPYLALHPELESVISYIPTVGDPVRLGVKKIDPKFKEVLRRIKEKNPGSNINV